MKHLICKIVADNPAVSVGRDIKYVVLDGDEVVASGISSSESWVKYDAGGYHTKKTFDDRYPEGWQVHFSF